MAVIINEFEVITEAPPPPTDTSGLPNGENPPIPPSQALMPDAVLSIWRHELDRGSRTYAG